VAINPTAQEQTLNMTFNNLEGLASLKVYRTSESENLLKLGKLRISNNRVTLQMTPQSIVTCSAKMN